MVALNRGGTELSPQDSLCQWPAGRLFPASGIELGIHPGIFLRHRGLDIHTEAESSTFWGIWEKGRGTAFALQRCCPAAC